MKIKTIKKSRIFALLFIANLILFNALSAGSGRPWRPTLRSARDINPDPNIVEVEIVAQEGLTKFAPGVGRTKVLTYNGTSPGPTIEANVGDTLIIHFYNELDEETSLHFHGVDVPAVMDGSNISQMPVAPGEYFRYEFKVPSAATHWYHPHFNTNEQIEKGLFGAMVFRDPNEECNLNIPKKNEHVLFVDDILLNEDDNEIAGFASDPTSSLNPLERADEALDSREGNVFLVNGKYSPRLRVRAGQPYRFRIVNPSNGASVRLSIPGQTVYRIGGDQGLLNEAIAVSPIDVDPITGISNPDPSKGILLTPSERADIVLIPQGEPGDKIFIEQHDLPRGRHEFFYTDSGSIGIRPPASDGDLPPLTVMELKITKKDKEDDTSGWTMPSPLRLSPIEEIELPSDPQILPIFFGHGPPSAEGNVMFFATVNDRDGLLNAVNNKMMAMPPMFGPKPFPMVTDADALNVKLGDVCIIQVVNFARGDHNFHIHGFPMQPIETEYVNGGTSTIEPWPQLEYKDTIRVPKRPAGMGSSYTIVRIAVRFDDSARPIELQRSPEEMIAFGKVPSPGASGGWLAHCHFLEHSRRGMTTYINVTAE